MAWLGWCRVERENQRIIAMLRCLGIAVFFAVIVGCSSGEAVDAKEQEWRARLEQFQPVGKTAGELFSWQLANGVRLNSFPNAGGVILEAVEGDGLFCSTWHVLLSIEVNASNQITEYSVSSAEACR